MQWKSEGWDRVNERIQADLDVEFLLPKLTADDLHIIKMRFYRDMTFTEMGVILGVSKQIILKRYCYLMGKMRRLSRRRHENSNLYCINRG